MADFERKHVPCVALHDRFKLTASGTNYTKQYSHMYVERTLQMKKVLSKLAAERWTDVPLADRVIDTEGSTKASHDWAIVGVIYKEMKLRGSVLDEFKGSGTGIITATDTQRRIASEDDYLVLEDESGRVVVEGAALQAQHMVSGVLIAVRGRVEGGVLQVNDVITYDAAYANQPLPADGDDRYVMLVSGLGVGRAHSPEEMVASKDPGDSDMARQLLLDWLSGRAGGDADAALAAKVVRLVLAGDSIDVPVIDHEAVSLTYGPVRTKLEKEHQAKSNNIIKRFDAYLATGLGALPIDVMPGGSDPAVQMMPQQPLHPCILPTSRRFSSLSLVTNPYDFRMGGAGSGCRFIGHAGQPVSDILTQTDLSSLLGPNEANAKESPKLCLQALKKTLQWAHLAPTAPDTLPCYPLTAGDPFIMPTINSRDNDPTSSIDDGNTPHVLFAGNQPCFASELVQTDKYRTLLVCVPVFRTTGTAVLINLRTLDATTLNFQLGEGEGGAEVRGEGGDAGSGMDVQ